MYSPIQNGGLYIVVLCSSFCTGESNFSFQFVNSRQQSFARYSMFSKTIHVHFQTLHMVKWSEPPKRWTYISQPVDKISHEWRKADNDEQCIIWITATIPSTPLPHIHTKSSAMQQPQRNLSSQNRNRDSSNSADDTQPLTKKLKIIHKYKNKNEHTHAQLTDTHTHTRTDSFICVL